MPSDSHKLATHLPVFESPEELRLNTWVQLVRTFSRVQRLVMQTLMAEDVTLAQFDLLATLRFNDGVTQQELAERLLVTKGNVCGLIDRLENIGWMQRRADDADGRVNRLHLTARGRKKIDALLPQHDELILKLLGSVPAQQIKSLQGMLEQVERAALSEN